MQQQVGQLVLLTCPTDRLSLPSRAAILRIASARNEQLRAMVAEGRGGHGAAEPAAGADAAAGGGAPLMLLDVDALTSRLPFDLKIGPQDYHVQCYLGSASKSQRERGAGLWLWLWLWRAVGAAVGWRCSPPAAAAAPPGRPLGLGPPAGGAVEWSGGDGSLRPAYPPMRYDHLRTPARWVGWGGMGVGGGLIKEAALR